MKSLSFTLKVMVAPILLLGVVLFFFACNVDNPIIQTPSDNVFDDWAVRVENDAAEFSKTYPVSETNPFVFASYDELMTHLKYGTGVVAFGFPECPRCRNAFPVLEKAFHEMDMDKHAGFRGRILYYNVYGDRESNNERYQAIVDYLGEFLQHDDSGNPRVYMPDIFFVAAGKIVGNHLDTVESLLDPYEPLNDEQEAELLGIYKNLMEKVEDCNC